MWLLQFDWLLFFALLFQLACSTGYLWNCSSDEFAVSLEGTVRYMCGFDLVVTVVLNYIVVVVYLLLLFTLLLFDLFTVLCSGVVEHQYHEILDGFRTIIMDVLFDTEELKKFFSANHPRVREMLLLGQSVRVFNELLLIVLVATSRQCAPFHSQMFSLVVC